MLGTGPVLSFRPTYEVEAALAIDVGALASAGTSDAGTSDAGAAAKGRAAPRRGESLHEQTRAASAGASTLLLSRRRQIVKAVMLGFQAVVVREVAAREARADTGADAANERAALASDIAGPREGFSELERAAAAIGDICCFAGLGCRRISSLWPLIHADSVDGRCGRIISRRGSLRRSRHFGGETNVIESSIEGHNVHRLRSTGINQ